MKVSRMVAVGLGSAALVATSATSASAGEVNGNGGPTQGPTHSRSLCAYSGLNDDPSESRVQSFGQIVRFAGPLGGANSVSTPFGEEGCNAKLYPNK
ncbi:hypothetical protein [Nocardioides aurantiacus]|uniref:hypothetical protein n=1 Tax=Nocardioides aurantiacus TaxID=86796 RepID=UPI00403F6BAA